MLTDLYLYSAELKAFESVGSFHKVSQSLKNAGITEDFLLELGVRRSIAVEVLFQNLSVLKWSKDPKPLVEYLRSASLTNKDINMLRQTQYLPAENDESRTFAPSELFLPGKFILLSLATWVSGFLCLGFVLVAFISQVSCAWADRPRSSFVSFC